VNLDSGYEALFDFTLVASNEKYVMKFHSDPSYGLVLSIFSRATGCRADSWYDRPKAY
jgi:hypothetical protein